MWRILKLCLVLIAFASVSLAQNECSGATSCQTCAMLGGCGWCAAVQECMPGDIAGPSAGTCLGEFSWDFGSVNCKDCSTVYGCRACTEEPDCIWCSDAENPVLGGQCIALGSVCSSPQWTCPCVDYVGCYSCRETEGCSWCDRDRICVETDNPPPEVADCSFSTECLCTDVDECFECKNQDGCGWCANPLTNGCKSLLSFPINCLPTAACPVPCAPNCENKECGNDGCNGLCGECPNGQYCNSDGECKGLPSAAGNFIGGMILGIALVIIGALGWAYYKKRQGGSAGYSGLN